MHPAPSIDGNTTVFLSPSYYPLLY